MNIDLHIHSTASDGTLSPREILAHARALSLGAVAITDHDTLRGAREALAAGIPDGLRFLTGVEISASPPPGFDLSGSFHLLGYCVDPENPALEAVLQRLQNARRDRNPVILARLRDLGVDISEAEVADAAPPGVQLGRPHIATRLVARGIVPDIDAAFDRYLGWGRPAYVDKYRVSAAEAIDVVRAAGGVPVMAHPGLLSVGRGPRFERLAAGLREAGLQGIEAWYSEHSPEQTQYYLRAARRHDLVATGGSDFHGDVRPEVRMGSGTGGLRVPMDVCDRLAARRPAR